MAPKKKTDVDVEKAKGKIAESARAVGKAAEKLTVPMSDLHFGRDWDKASSDVDALDKEFNGEEAIQKEDIVDFLRSKLRSGEHEVRVLQVGPQGGLIDVSDRVRAQDLRPEDIGGIQTEDGKTVPLGRDPQNREAAYRALQEILPNLKERASWKPRPQTGKSRSVREMELVLEESDKILEHWKK